MLQVGRILAQPAERFYDPAWGGGGSSLAREQRRLAAIIAADVVGYSRLMGRDESGTLRACGSLASSGSSRQNPFEPQETKMSEAVMAAFGVTDADLPGSGWEGTIYALGATRILRNPKSEASSEDQVRARATFTQFAGGKDG